MFPESEFSARHGGSTCTNVHTPHVNVYISLCVYTHTHIHIRRHIYVDTLYPGVA